jgi:hypothetical protein
MEKDEKKEILDFFNLNNSIGERTGEDYELRCRIFNVYYSELNKQLSEFFDKDAPELKCDFINESINEYSYKNMIYRAIRNAIVFKIMDHIPKPFNFEKTYDLYFYKELDLHLIRDDATPDNGIIPISMISVQQFISDHIGDLASVIQLTVGKMKLFEL